MSLATQALLVFALAALAAGGALWAIFQPRLDGGTRASDRLRLVVTGGRAAKRGGSAQESGRKQSVEQVLRELADKQNSARGRKKVSLKLRMRQAGLGWSRTTYFVLCFFAFVFGTLLALGAFGVGEVPALAFGVAAGLLLPHYYVNRKRNRRLARFTAELPEALDLIVRGVKSGLPLSDCVRALAAEAQEPIRGEFKTIIDDHTMGLPLDEAAARLPERIPVPEATFFAIVIAIQSRTGGSLSEALGNLSKVVRERKKMANKVQAMSSEAKASAGILGALPFLITGVTYLTSPDYISLLFTTLAGNVILVLSGLWMLIGLLVMRKMINFDF